MVSHRFLCHFSRPCLVVKRFYESQTFHGKAGGLSVCFWCLHLPSSLPTTCLEQGSGHCGPAGRPCRAHLGARALPGSLEERFLPPLCRMWSLSPCQAEKRDLCTVLGWHAASCQQQVTCRGIVLWARNTLDWGLTEGSACPGVPREPKSEAASSMSQQKTKYRLVCWPWAHGCGHGTTALHEPVSFTCLLRTCRAKYPRGPHISEDDAMPPADGLFGKKCTDSINHNQTTTAITHQENWSNSYVVVRKEQRYKHHEPRQERTHMSERKFFLVTMRVRQPTPYKLFEKVPSLKLQ